MVYKNCQYSWDIPSAQGIGQTTFLAFSLNELLPIHNISAFLASLVRITWGLLYTSSQIPLESTEPELSGIHKALWGVARPGGPLIGSEHRCSGVTSGELLLPLCVEENQPVLPDSITLSHT